MDSESLKNRLSFNIKRLRKKASMTQSQLAEKADLSEATINSIEGCRLWPSDKTFLKICEALDSDVYSLFLPDDVSLETNGNAFREIQTLFAKRLKKALIKTIDDVFSDAD